MRRKWTGSVSGVRRWMARWMALSAVGAIVLVSPAGVFASSGPLGTETSSNELMVILAPGADGPDLARAFKDAGFSAPQGIIGLQARYRDYRRVSVASADTGTREALLQIPGVVGVRSIYRASGIEYPILSNGQVIARFKSGTTQAQVRQIAADAGMTVARQMVGLPQAYVFDCDEGSRTVEECAGALTGMEEVRWVHPSLLFKLQSHASGPIEDTLYPYQWHLNNIGQLPNGRPGADIDVEGAWNATLGGGAIVAVIDECLQRDHPDLAPNYLTGYDFLAQTDDPSPTLGPATAAR